MSRSFLILALLAACSAMPTGPQPVAWDRESCAHCRMVVSDPRFAAQIITAEGDVLHFDDPGCLSEYVTRRAPAVRETWYHAHDTERWLPADAVDLRAVGETPMGFGKAAFARAVTP